MPSYSRTFEPVGAPTTKRLNQGMSAAEFKRQAAGTIAAGERAVELMRAHPSRRNSAATTVAQTGRFSSKRIAAKSPAALVDTWAVLAERAFAPYAARAQRAGLTAAQTDALRVMQTPAQIDAALRRFEAAL